MKARQQIETLAGNGQRRALTPAVILFIALPETEDKPGVTEVPLTLLPRLCPFCGKRTIIGHGRKPEASA